MSVKTQLQQLMGGTSTIKEGFGNIPDFGMASLFGNNDNDKPATTETSGTPATRSTTATATPATPMPNAIREVGTGITTPGSDKQLSNTNAIMTNKQQLNTSDILVFTIHVLFAIAIAYIWGILGSNALFLITRSTKEKEYILPTERYDAPYCSNADKPCFFSYGFPYNLMPRVCTETNLPNVVNMETENVYLLNAVEKGGTGNGVSQALYNYIFDSVYGGLGQGARSFASGLLNLFDTNDTSKGYDENTWDNMQASGGRKFLIFILFPLILQFLIYGLGLVAGVSGLIFGIVSKHPFWGIIFTLFFGFFIAFGNGIWMMLQSIYVFCFYPCLNIRNKNEYNAIFNNVKPYMLFIFYTLIALYAFQDLGNSGGAGILFLIIVAYFTGNAA
jgi:hypothetical protein